MQWGQIKTLFILSFLVLDLFLLQQFLSKQAEAELGDVTLSTTEESTSEKLKDAGIKVSSDVPREAPSVSVIQASLGEFTKENLNEYQKMGENDNQEINVYNNNLIQATFKKPIELAKVNKENIISKVNNYIPFSDQYSYWGWNKESGVALFFQTAKNRTFYFNKGGLLMVRINEGEMTGYIATKLGSPEEPAMGSQNSSLIAPLKVIDKLYKNGYIGPGDEVTEAMIGYHTSINLEPGEENGTQVFAPTWKITVNSEKDYFVRAKQGTILNINEENFIQNAVESFRRRIEQAQSKKTDSEKDSLEESN